MDRTRVLPARAERGSPVAIRGLAGANLEYLLGPLVELNVLEAPEQRSHARRPRAQRLERHAREAVALVVGAVAIAGDPGLGALADGSQLGVQPGLCEAGQLRPFQAHARRVELR